jgi:hypothetical protein
MNGNNYCVDGEFVVVKEATCCVLRWCRVVVDGCLVWWW